MLPTEKASVSGTHNIHLSFSQSSESFEGEILSILAVKYSVTDQQLDAMISDVHIREISQFLVGWKDLAKQLGLDQLVIDDIQHSPRITVVTREHRVLTAWKNAYFRQATYRKLLEVLDKYQSTCAGHLCDLICDYGESRSMFIALLGFAMYMCICSMYV